MSTIGRKNQQKKLKKWGEEVGDRISSLSDELLHKILSFMHAKYAVQTCALSKRWQSLWKSLPYLDFSLETFPFKRKFDIVSVSNFITQVLFRCHRHTDLVKVCFEAYGSNHYGSIVQGLIEYALDHNVQQLTIASEMETFWGFVMPQSFYTCKSLTALQLFDLCGDTIKVPKFLDLPALKSLHVDGFTMPGEYLNHGDFSGCPNLETLKLTHISLVADKTLFIKAPNLKRLEVHFREYNGEVECNRLKVVINAPGLMTFWCSAEDPVVCSFEDLASILIYMVISTLMMNSGNMFLIVSTLLRSSVGQNLSLYAGKQLR